MHTPLRSLAATILLSAVALSAGAQGGRSQPDGAAVATQASYVKLALSADPIRASHAAVSRPMQVAMQDNLVHDRLRSMIPAGNEGPASEPNDWMLILLGVFLVGAIAHRRISSLNG